MQPITYERDQLDFRVVFEKAAYFRRLIYRSDFDYPKEKRLMMAGFLEGLEACFYNLGIMDDYFQYLDTHH